MARPLFKTVMRQMAAIFNDVMLTSDPWRKLLYLLLYFHNYGKETGSPVRETERPLNLVKPSLKKSDFTKMIY